MPTLNPESQTSRQTRAARAASLARHGLKPDRVREIVPAETERLAADMVELATGLGGSASREELRRRGWADAELDRLGAGAQALAHGRLPQA